MREFIFTWDVENISYSWHSTGERIISPTFYAGPLFDTCWALSLYPRGNRNSDYLSLYMYREKDDGPESLAINYELSCITADTSPLSICFVPETCMTFERGGTSGFGESHFIKRQELFGRKKNLQSDTLTLRCRMWKDDGDTHEFGEMFGSTRLAIERIVSTHAFSPEKSTKKNFYIQSELQSKVLFSVSIYYNGDSVDLILNPIGDGKVKSSTCKLTIVDPKTDSKLCEHKGCFFKNLNNEIWRLPLLYKVPPEENGSSDENDLEFKTEFIYSTGDEYETIEKNWTPRIPEFLPNYLESCYPNKKETDSPSIWKELWNLYLKKSFCDMELKTEKKSFFVHTFVLCARSPVFLPMLTGKMKENRTKCIEIEDISAEILEKFLTFLYTDAFEDFEWYSAIELYYAADKYQVQRLKLLCSSYLLRNVDCDRVCELLALADRHSDDILKLKVHDFIWKNEKEVFSSISWKDYASKDKDMALSTMLSKYENKENNSSTRTFDDILSSFPDVLEDFESFYKSQITSDIVIRTSSSSFPAHKVVLFASSSTFLDMYVRKCLKRKPTDFFKIKGLEDGIVYRMLVFLYSDSLEDVQWETAIKLYHAAEMFRIERLKFGCSCFLLKNLRVSNVGDLLLLSHEKRDVKLKAAVDDYISLYDEEVFGSDEWCTFSKANSDLALETMLSRYKRI